MDLYVLLCCLIGGMLLISLAIIFYHRREISALRELRTHDLREIEHLRAGERAADRALGTERTRAGKLSEEVEALRRKRAPTWSNVPEVIARNTALQEENRLLRLEVEDLREKLQAAYEEVYGEGVGPHPEDRMPPRLTPAEREEDAAFLFGDREPPRSLKDRAEEFKPDRRPMPHGPGDEPEGPEPPEELESGQDAETADRAPATATEALMAEETKRAFEASAVCTQGLDHLFARLCPHARGGRVAWNDPQKATRAFDAMMAAAAPARHAPTFEFIDVVFDGAPAMPAPRFVEVEDAAHRSVAAGNWRDRGDGTWGLRFKVLSSEVRR